MTGDLFPETVNAVPPGSTASWFTDLGWFLGFEARLLREGLIARPFDMDPCGHPDAPVTQEIARRGGLVCALAAGYPNGLEISWAGRVWFWNPPYDAETLDVFAPKVLVEKHRAKHGAAGLLPAWTDRGWWHDIIEPDRKSDLIDLDFIKGRLTFGWPGNPKHEGGETAKFPSASVVWRASKL